MLSGRKENKRVLSLTPSAWQVNSAPSYYVFEILLFPSFYKFNTSPPALEQRHDIAIDRRFRTWDNRARMLTGALGVGKDKECNPNNGEGATPKVNNGRCTVDHSDGEADKADTRGG